MKGKAVIENRTVISCVLTIYKDPQGQAINSCCDQYKCTFVALGNTINCITIRRRALCTVYILITKGQVSGSEAQSMNIVVLAIQADESSTHRHSLPIMPWVMQCALIMGIEYTRSP